MNSSSAEFAQGAVTVKEDPNQTVHLGMDCSINFWDQDQPALLSKWCRKNPFSIVCAEGKGIHLKGVGAILQRVATFASINIFYCNLTWKNNTGMQWGWATNSLSNFCWQKSISLVFEPSQNFGLKERLCSQWKGLGWSEFFLVRKVQMSKKETIYISELLPFVVIYSLHNNKVTCSTYSEECMNDQ